MGSQIPLTIRRLHSGSSFETLAGYSRAVVVEHGDFAEVFISGCTGFDYAAMTISDDVLAQTRQCFTNIAKVLGEAGGGLCDVVRARYYLTDVAYWEGVAPVLGDIFAGDGPAATCLICGLVDARMKIEVEIDARIPR